MLKQILRFKTALMFSLGLALFSPGAFAQNHDGGHDGGGSHFNRGSGGQVRSYARGSRHYYHNGNWNRNGWYGWGVPGPVYSDGVLVGSLPPGYTTVMVQGNTYYYGNSTYFRQMSSGGFVVVTVPVIN